MALAEKSIKNLAFVLLVVLIGTSGSLLSWSLDCAASGSRTAMCGATGPAVSFQSDSHTQSAYRSDVETPSASVARTSHPTGAGIVTTAVAAAGYFLSTPAGLVMRSACDKCSLSLVTQHIRLQI